MPEQPKQELWIALAGPAVNVAIAVLLYSWLSFEHVWEPLGRLRIATGPFFERLLVVNISLVLFNLIPAFPMDGGRVLRALLAWRIGFPRATKIAAAVGQGIAVVFALIGLFTSPLLILIALFVWFAARQEASFVQTKSLLSNTPARAAMLSDFEILEPYDVLGDALRMTLRGSQHDFPVVEKGRVIGMLTRTDLLAGLAQHGPDQPVTSLMRHDFPAVQFHETLDTVLQRLQESDSETMPLVQDGRLLGLVTLDNLNEYLLIRSILEKRAVRDRGRAAGETAPI
jgi:CBS domain-containing protein